MQKNKSWKLKVRGKILATRRTDIDKSGRNPSYLIYGEISVAEFAWEGAEFELPSPLPFKGGEKEILSQLGKEIAPGDQVTLHFAGTETPRGRFEVAEQ